MIIRCNIHTNSFISLINKQDLNYYSNHSNGFPYQTASRNNANYCRIYTIDMKALADVTYYGISKGYTDIASSYWGERLATQIIDLQTGDYYVTAHDTPLGRRQALIYNTGYYFNNRKTL